MEATYSGEPIILDPEGTIQRFIDQWHIANHRAMCPHVGEGIVEYTIRHDLQIPIPNWPELPVPGVNTLTWPTGASRWAVGYVLISLESHEKIKKTATSTPRTFSVVEGANTLTTSLYHLTPRRISSGDDGMLFLYPLVDERYFWQFRPVTTAIVDATTWANVIETTRDALGKTSQNFTYSAISADYLKPDATSLDRTAENAAQLMDSICQSVGRRFVRQLDGTCKLQTAAEAVTSLASQRLELDLIAGFVNSNSATRRPEKVRVKFGKRITDTEPPDTQCLDYYTSDQTYSGDDHTGLIHSVFSAAFAAFTTAQFEADPTAPNNTTALNTLAAKIAADFWAWWDERHEYIAPSIKPWVMTGFDDYVQWEIATCRPDYDRCEILKLLGKPDDGSMQLYPTVTSTKIVTLPENFATQFQSSQTAYVDPCVDCCNYERVKMIQTGGADGTASTQASWTYSIKNWAETVTYATAVDPTDATSEPGGMIFRPALGSIEAATEGFAMFVGGEPFIISCNEGISTAPCT